MYWNVNTSIKLINRIYNWSKNESSERNDYIAQYKYDSRTEYAVAKL